MFENIRKLVTVRSIDALTPIEGADLIEAASIEGWTVVVKKGEFQVGDKCVYIEIDSFLKDGVPAWQFLVDKSSRTFEGVKGHKVRTMKLRGIISQGFVLPLKVVPEITDLSRDVDQSELLGIKKWEASLPACLQGQAQGLFPSFIRKTDQERIQNLKNEVFGYEDIYVPFDTTNIPEDAVLAMVAKGDAVIREGKTFKVMKARASVDDRYEVSMKLDGSSMTTFARIVDGQVESGVCSRNLQLKINDENAGNSFVSMAVNSGLLKALEYMAAQGVELAVQGELLAPGIQENQEMLSAPEFFVFDIFDIANQEYMSSELRHRTLDRLVELGVKVKHVPVLEYKVKLCDIGLSTVGDILKFAEGPSLNATQREGVVFKRADGQFSFKAISNKWLLKSTE
jgi:RNA ligase (TIGR02306 family)